jgi:hypothetical protein
MVSLLTSNTPAMTFCPSGNAFFDTDDFRDRKPDLFIAISEHRIVGIA